MIRHRKIHSILFFCLALLTRTHAAHAEPGRTLGTPQNPNGGNAQGQNPNSPQLSQAARAERLRARDAQRDAARLKERAAERAKQIDRETASKVEQLKANGTSVFTQRVEQAIDTQLVKGMGPTAAPTLLVRVGRQAPGESTNPTRNVTPFIPPDLEGRIANWTQIGGVMKELASAASGANIQPATDLASLNKNAELLREAVTSVATKGQLIVPSVTLIQNEAMKAAREGIPTAPGAAAPPVPFHFESAGATTPTTPPSPVAPLATRPPTPDEVRQRVELAFGGVAGFVDQTVTKLGSDTLKERDESIREVQAQAAEAKRDLSRAAEDAAQAAKDAEQAANDAAKDAKQAKQDGGAPPGGGGGAGGGGAGKGGGGESAKGATVAMPDGLPSSDFSNTQPNRDQSVGDLFPSNLNLNGGAERGIASANLSPQGYKVDGLQQFPKRFAFADTPVKGGSVPNSEFPNLGGKSNAGTGIQGGGGAQGAADAGGGGGAAPGLGASGAKGEQNFSGGVFDGLDTKYDAGDPPLNAEKNPGYGSNGIEGGGEGGDVPSISKAPKEGDGPAGGPAMLALQLLPQAPRNSDDPKLQKSIMFYVAYLRRTPCRDARAATIGVCASARVKFPIPKATAEMVATADRLGAVANLPASAQGRAAGSRTVGPK